jgi:protein-tyrosine-phosphatase
MRRALDTDLDRRHDDGTLSLAPFMVLSKISRRIERISDEVRDVCAETIYMCTGDFAKHGSPEAYRVLFVDQHNHCRSQMAEAVAASLNQPRLLVSSAGLDPRPLDPRLPAFLRSKGLDLGQHRPKSIEQIPNLRHYHVVVAFDEGAYYALRFRRTPTVCIEWAVADPSTAEGSPELVHEAYERTFEFISTQLKDLVEAILRQG